MVFTSFVFLFWFLPLFLPLYFAAPRQWRNAALIVGSFVFYGWWRPQYVLLMLASVLVDYVVARAMGERGDRPANVGHRRTWLLLSVVLNLGMLGWFKYANLLMGTWNDLAPWPVAWEQVLLPVGISFFTFQSLSYTVDVYRGVVPPTRSWLDLLCYVSMFPQLVAGPIVRYRDISASLRDRGVDLRDVSDGVVRFAIGFCKKVLLADSIAVLVDQVHTGAAPGLIAAWLGAVGYSFQIYFDFSGYSDMAIGLGRVLGFHFPENFRSPYRAHSITDFWRRWHISLSTWLRDYLYVPLGGNRRGEAIAQRNVFTTMLLGGLWHGASWTFVLWGAWHGVFLVLERRLGRVTPYARLPRIVQVLLTFAIWTVGMVAFRCHGFAELVDYGGGLLGRNGVGAVPDLGQQQPYVVAAMLAAAAIVWGAPRSDQLVARWRPGVVIGVLLVFVVAVAHALAADHQPFIYFQF